MSWKQNVVKKFDNKAVHYDKNSAIQKAVANTLIEDLPEGQDAEKITDILEVGCGTGHLTLALFEKYSNKNICVSDLSKSMVTQAQINCHETAIAQGHKTRWAVFDAEYPPEAMEGQFDLIVANMVFQWFEDIEIGLDHLKGLLKPGGEIIYSMVGPESFMEWTEILEELKYPVGILDFSMPEHIYKEEFIAKTYSSASEFLHVIKDIGAGQAKKGSQRLSLKQIRQACDIFNDKYDTSVTWHILYGSVQNKERGTKKRMGLRSV